MRFGFYNIFVSNIAPEMILFFKSFSTITTTMSVEDLFSINNVITQCNIKRWKEMILGTSNILPQNLIVFFSKQELVLIDNSEHQHQNTW
jgi:hypothetical protein